MGTYLRDRAIVLTVRPYREADAWVSLWTEHHGKQEVFAAGLKRTNARHQGHLQPFSVVEVMIAHGKVIDRIAVAQMTVLTANSVRTHEAWSLILGSLAGMCHQLTDQHAQEPQVFLFFLSCLKLSETFRDTFSPERLWLVWGFALHLLAKYLGYGVSFSRCARCGGSPLIATVFSIKEGGFLCAVCDKATFAAHSSPLQTNEETLRKALLFFETASLEQVIRLSAPRVVLTDLAIIIEATLALLPIDSWQKYKRNLDSFRALSLPKHR